MEDKDKPAPRKRGTRSADGESASSARGGSRKNADDPAAVAKTPRKRASAADTDATSGAMRKAPRKRSTLADDPATLARARARRR
jgi:hypothetical protein